MSIVIQRNYVNCKMSGDLPNEVFNELRTEMRYSRPGYRFSYVYKKGWGDGYVYLITPKRRIFPSGLLYVVERVLKSHDIEYTINDLRKEPKPSNALALQGKKLRDYQQEALLACLTHKNGVIKIPTGGGKTLIFTSLLGQLNGLKRIVYVRKLDLMVQTIKNMEQELGIEVGQIGGGKIDIKDLSVVMIPTAARALGEKYVKYSGHEEDDEDDKTRLSIIQKEEIKEYIESAKCFIIDECHCISSESAQMVSRHSKNAYYRLGFSATPWRTDGTDILINAVTGPMLIDIKASELIKRGFLVPPRVHFYRIPRDQNKKVPKDFQNVYSEFIVNNDVRNAKIVDLAVHLVKHDERPVILVQRQQHGKDLEDRLTKKGLLVKFIYGESSMTERSFTLGQFEAGTLDVLIGSTILQEGIDVPCITALINASGGKSSSAYYQKIGRAIRPYEDKTRAIIIDFIDSVKWLDKHSNERIRVLETEPLYQVKVQGRKNDR